MRGKRELIMKKVLLIMMGSFCLEAMEDFSKSKLRFWYVVDESAKIHYLPSKQVDYFNELFSTRVPSNCPFIQVKKTVAYYAKSAAESELIKDDGFINNKRVPLLNITKKNGQKWPIINNGIPLVCLTSYKKIPLSVTYDNQTEIYEEIQSNSLLIFNKLALFKENPLSCFLDNWTHSMQMNEQSSLYRNYLAELVDNNILVQEGPTYKHGVSGWFSMQERAETAKALLLKNFVDKENTKKALLVPNRIIGFITKNPAQVSIDALLLIKRR